MQRQIDRIHDFFVAQLTKFSFFLWWAIDENCDCFCTWFINFYRNWLVKSRTPEVVSSAIYVNYSTNSSIFFTTDWQNWQVFQWPNLWNEISDFFFYKRLMKSAIFSYIRLTKLVIFSPMTDQCILELRIFQRCWHLWLSVGRLMKFIIFFTQNQRN